MSLKLAPPEPHRNDSPWGARFFQALFTRPGPRSGPPVPGPRGPSSGRGNELGAPSSGNGSLHSLLEENQDETWDDEQTARSWDCLHEQMAVIPMGTIPVIQPSGVVETAEVGAFYLDRYAVTNRDFERFVASGAYDNLELWPRSVWSSLMKFVDRTGRPGPRGWQGGCCPSNKADHPVVGISWYEAVVYAKWVGKRLPTAVEWQKAAGWPEDLAGGIGNRYPWGDIFIAENANLGASGARDTMPVTAFEKGVTPNGIYQLAGNVWEWLEDPLQTIPCTPSEMFVPWQPMRRIAGGAFNTYFPTEATCPFITGQPELDRRPNIGFRCAISCDRLRQES